MPLDHENTSLQAEVALAPPGPREMTPRERRRAIAAILARGIRRILSAEAQRPEVKAVPGAELVNQERVDLLGFANRASMAPERPINGRRRTNGSRGGNEP